MMLRSPFFTSWGLIRGQDLVYHLTLQIEEGNVFSNSASEKLSFRCGRRQALVRSNFDSSGISILPIVIQNPMLMDAK